MNDQLLDDTYQQTYEGTVKNGLTVREGGRRQRQSKKLHLVHTPEVDYRVAGQFGL